MCRSCFSSQQRGYPAIADIVAPAPVAGIALGEASFDGLAWSADGHVEPIARMTVVGLPMQTFDRVPQVGHGVEDPTHDRARRVFGSAGIARLHSLKIAIIGAGGGAMQLAQLCAKLGVGGIVGVDWDRIQLPNVPRLVGASIADALEARPKLALMAELVAAAGRGTAFEPLVGDVYDQAVAWRLRDVDCLFLAVDTLRARSVFNALCHTYLIPGFQIGARVEAPRGEVDLVYAVERVVFPDHGCLACGRWINPWLLHRELLTPDERRAEAYGIPDDATDPIDPNVITLDAVGAALAANDFLFAFTGLHREGVHTEHRQEHLDRRESLREKPQRDGACLWCGRSARSAYAVGDARDVLPCRTTPAAHDERDRQEQERKGEGR